ncbi:MAG TPA: PHB depolymerase family esterase [Gemmatimonadaceae bacterium]|nr:PHB depolymerase family esterase [Gemmatimonadaceae bacterium]
MMHVASNRIAPSPAGALRVTATALVLAMASVTGLAQPTGAGATLPSLPRDSVRVGSLSRSFSYYVPGGTIASAPLVLAFHGAGGSGARLRGFTDGHLERLADREGFVLVYPDGVGGTWNDCRAGAPYEAKRRNVDDVAFARALTERFRESHAIDTTAVFALGYSNGAHLAFRLALEAPELVRAIAAFGANLPAEDDLDCGVRGESVPVMIVNGTADPINPFEGGVVVIPTGDTIGSVRSATATAEYFAGLDGRVDSGSSTRLHAPDDRGLWVDRVRLGDGLGVEVVLYTIGNGGHAIPGPRARFPALVGATEGRFDALEAAIRFFLREAGQEVSRRGSG